MPRDDIVTGWNIGREDLNYLLQEALGKILQEDGSGILLEKSNSPIWGGRAEVTSAFTGRTIPSESFS